MILVRIASPLIDLRIIEPHKLCGMLFCILESWFDALSNGFASIIIDMHVHPPTSFTAETFSSCLSWLHSPSPPMQSYNLEPSKLEGCWSAHPRCVRADSQLVVERQYGVGQCRAMLSHELIV